MGDIVFTVSIVAILSTAYKIFIYLMKRVMSGRNLAKQKQKLTKLAYSNFLKSCGVIFDKIFLKYGNQGVLSLMTELDGIFKRHLEADKKNESNPS